MASNFTSFRSAPLTLEEIAHYAPSALATHAHESRSSKYTYIPTIEVIQGMMHAGFQPFKATQSLCRLDDKRNYTKHMIRFRHPDTAISVGDIFSEVILINSHDGTSRYKLLLGLFRALCGNGMCTSESELASVSVPHKGNILDNVIEGSYRLVENSDKVMETVQRWNRLQLTDGEQNVLAEAAHQVRFADEEGKVTTPITSAQLLTANRSADYGNDLWRTFNRIQENTVRGGLRGRIPAHTDEEGRYHSSRRMRTREVRGIDQDVKLNRALWTLAEKMEQLKTGN